MKKWIWALVINMGIALASVANAAWDNGAVSGTRITDITVLQDGSFYVKFDKDICDPGVNKVGYVYLGQEPNGVSQTQAGVDMMLRTATAAYLSGRPVTVYADDSGSAWGCHMGAIKF